MNWIGFAGYLSLLLGYMITLPVFRRFSEFQWLSAIRNLIFAILFDIFCLYQWNLTGWLFYLILIQVALFFPKMGRSRWDYIGWLAVAGLVANYTTGMGNFIRNQSFTIIRIMNVYEFLAILLVIGSIGLLVLYPLDRGLKIHLLYGPYQVKFNIIGRMAIFGGLTLIVFVIVQNIVITFFLLHFSVLILIFIGIFPFYSLFLVIFYRKWSHAALHPPQLEPDHPKDDISPLLGNIPGNGAGIVFKMTGFESTAAPQNIGITRGGGESTASPHGLDTLVPESDLYPPPEFCPICQQPLHAGAICESCLQKICPKCLNPNPLDIRYCECGFLLPESPFPDRTSLLITDVTNSDLNDTQQPITKRNTISPRVPADEALALRLCPYCHAVGWKDDICRCGYNYLTKKFLPKNS
jgi:hypothetical protein